METSTYNKRYSGIVRNLGNCLEIRHIVPRVPDALKVDSLCLVVDQLGNVLGAVAIDELSLDAQTRQEHLELIVGSAVEVRGRDDVVAGMSKGSYGHELGRLTR